MVSKSILEDSYPDSSATTVDFTVSIQDRLAMVEELMRAQADEHHPNLKLALTHLLSSGGKRIRPAVVLLTGGMLDGDSDHMVTLAAAIELLHTATLVHDDLIDGSSLRRGIPTLNAQWTPAATVLTGDFIFSRSARLAAELQSLRLQRMFAETLATIVNGEITQMFAGQGEVSREGYDFRIYSKTGSLFELAASAAALLSRTDEEVIESARCFGYSLGMAFQMVDDILDLTSEQTTIGKPVASDLRHGLITLPALYYLESTPNDPVIARLRDGETVADEEVVGLVGAIRESGAIQRALSEARRYIEQGLGYLYDLPDTPQRNSLEELSRYIVDRRM
jgi:geranylgeranyl pyrophosphate synthase